MPKTITITIGDNNSLKLDFSEPIVFTDALCYLATAVTVLCENTADRAFNDTSDDGRPSPERYNEIRGDIADMVNCVMTNVLDKLCPDTIDHKLTATAIATLENEIIHYADKHKITLEEAITKYQEKLSNSKYAAHFSNSLVKASPSLAPTPAPKE